MSTFFMLNDGEMELYDELISRSKEKYIYFFVLEH